MNDEALHTAREHAQDLMRKQAREMKAEKVERKRKKKRGRESTPTAPKGGGSAAQYFRMTPDTTP